MIRIFNLTDVPTPPLTQYGWLNQTFIIGRESVAPGNYLDVPDTEYARAKIRTPIRVGALCVGQPPPTYLQNKARQGKALLAASRAKLPASPPPESEAAAAPVEGVVQAVSKQELKAETEVPSPSASVKKKAR